MYILWMSLVVLGSNQLVSCMVSKSVACIHCILECNQHMHWHALQLRVISVVTVSQGDAAEVQNQIRLLIATCRLLDAITEEHTVIALCCSTMPCVSPTAQKKEFNLLLC